MKLKTTPRQKIKKSHGGSKHNKARLKAQAPHATTVAVAGTFNGWQPQSLEREPGGAWALELDLEPGIYEYRFLIDGDWHDDPDNVSRIPNAFGGFNAVIVIQ